MIRINLLGVPKQKRGKRQVTMPVMSGDGPSPLVAALVVFALAGAMNYYYFWRLNSQHEKIQSDIAAADVETKRLSQVKAAFLEKQKQADMYKRRFDVIDQLKAQQSGPVTLLAMIGDTVNKTDAVWLNSMLDEGTAVNINGVALSNVAVANLMANLRSTGHFKSVELKQTQQDDVAKDLQSFVFTLVCEKQKV
jgi:type IV pilus assembly protein PilN